MDFLVFLAGKERDYNVKKVMLLLDPLLPMNDARLSSSGTATTVFI